ncbi:hypothetical protein RP20_CCG002948 [Aedes albopictus]|nr:hypothetical protein RP20_CCG002948 [Aedes albopictus]
MTSPEIIAVQIVQANNELVSNEQGDSVEMVAPLVDGVQHDDVEDTVADVSGGTPPNPEQSIAESRKTEQQVQEAPQPLRMDGDAHEPCSSSRNVDNGSPNANRKRNNSGAVQLQKSQKKHASTEMKFRSFNINWSKISDNVLSRLHAMQDFKDTKPNAIVPSQLRVTKSELTMVTTCIVDQLRMIDTVIGASIMENVARQILQKFPCLESTDDDGFGAGQAVIELKFKMIHRNNYLNRFKTSTATTSNDAMLPKKFRNARAGTLKEYWMKSSNQCNKEILSKLARDEPNLLTNEFLLESQAYVRFRLDEKIDTSCMLSKLPVIRRRRLLNFHFKQATGENIDVFRKYFSAKRDKIIRYSLTCKAGTHLEDTSSDTDILRFLCTLTGEKFDDLVHLKEIGTRLDSITTGSPGPVLVAVDIGCEKHMFYVYANEVRLSEGANDIVTAIEDLFSVQYVYNFMYPKLTSKFLELLQEYFFKIITVEGSKSTATRVGQRQRVVRKIISALSNFETSLPIEPGA